MENKNQTVVLGIILLVVGVAVGYGVRGMRENAVPKPVEQYSQPMGMTNTNAMHGAMDDMMVGLKGKTGDAFDKAFLDEMIVHHEGAVEMANQVLEVTKREELRNLAFQIIAAQTTEIEQMNAWRAAWFK